ncbi:MAG: S-layer family protein, partial [Betaproteobacteria bacterium]
NTTLNAGAGAITFASTLDGLFSLAANSTGTTTFGGAVGGTAALTTLTTNAGGTTAINGGAVTTSAAQTYNDAVTLGAATTLTGVGVTFATTVDGANTLTVNDSGTTIFGGVVGGTTALTSVTTNAAGTTAINGGTVTTTGAQTYNDAVTFGANTTLTTTGGGAVSFLGGSESSTGAVRNLTVAAGTGDVTVLGNMNAAGGFNVQNLDITGGNVKVGATTPTTTAIAVTGQVKMTASGTVDLYGGSTVATTGAGTQTGRGTSAAADNAVAVSIQAAGNVTFGSTAGITATTTAANSAEVISTGGNIALGQVQAGSAGTVYLQATAAGKTILDSNGATNNVTALALNARADTKIGDVTSGGKSVLVGPTDAIETAVTNLNLTTTGATGTEIAVDNTGGTLTAGGNLTMAVNNAAGLGVATTGLNNVWLKNSQGLDVSAYTMQDKSNYGFISGTGALTVQAAAINVGTGNLNLQGSTDIVNLGTVTANNLLMKSGSSETLTTTVSGFDGTVNGTGNNLTVTQTGPLVVKDVDGDGQSVSVQNGNFTLTVNGGDLTVLNNLQASDLTANGARAGLIDIAVNGGNFIMDSGTITSTNSVDQSAAGGLGTAVTGTNTGQVSVRILLDNVAGATRTISVGNGAGGADTAINAIGGDIILDAINLGAQTPNHSVTINGDASVASYNNAGDPVTGTATLSGNVTINGGSFTIRSARAGALAGSDANIVITPAGLVGSGVLTLSPGSANSVIVQNGGKITVTEGATTSGDLIITNAKSVDMQGATSNISVDGSLTIGAAGTPLAGFVNLNNVTVDANGNGQLGAGASSLKVYATGDVTLNGTVNANAANNALRGNTVLIQTGGALTDPLGTGLIKNAYSTTITAATGVGTIVGTTINPITMDSARVDVSTTAGDLAILSTPQNPANFSQTGVIVTQLKNSGAGKRVYFNQTNTRDLILDSGANGGNDGANVITSSGGRIDVIAHGKVTQWDNISSGGGQIVVDPTDIDVNAVTNAAGGNIFYEADGNIAFKTGGQLITSGTGTITVNADHNLDSAGSVTFNVAGANATTGAILSNSGGTGAILVNSPSIALRDFAIGAGTAAVTLNAGTGATPAGTITSTQTVAANQDVTGGVVTLNVINTAGGDLVGAAAAPARVAAATRVNATLSGTGNAARNAYLSSPGAMPLGLIEVDGSSSGGSGNVTLKAGGAISDANSGSTNVHANALTMTAAGGIGTTAAPFNSNVASIAATTSAAGDIVIRETDAVTLNAMSTNAATNGNISVTAGGTETVAAALSAGGSGTVTLTVNGAASDVLINGAVSSTSGAINVTAGRAITETAPGTFGTSGLLTTQSNAGQTLASANTVGGFNASNNGSGAAGNISLTNTAPTLTISGITQLGGGNVTVANTGAITTTGGITAAANGNIGLTASGTETIGAVVTAGGSGTVTLTANGASSDVLINAPVGSISGAINVTAGRAVTEAGIGAIGTSGLLTVNATAGATLAGANTVGNFNATNTAGGNLVLTNTASPLTITGMNNTGSGTSTVTNTGAIVIGGTAANSVTTAGTNITVTSTSGNITLTKGISTGGAAGMVTVNAKSGSILGNGGTITSNSAKLLASGTVGTYSPSAPISVVLSSSATTALQAQAGAMDGSGFSINVIGTVPSNNIDLINQGATPGLVMLNGRILNDLQVPGVNPVAGRVALAVAGQVPMTGNGELLPPAPTSVAASFLETAYPSDNVRFQMTFGGGIVGMLNPLLTLEGIGVNVPGDVANAFGRQRREEDERNLKKRR